VKRACRFALAVCCLFLCLAVFLSCSSNRAVVGRWETQIEDEDLGKVTIVYHFTEDGEIFLEQKQGDAIPFSIPFGSFSVSGERLTIESDGSRSEYTFSVTEEELYLSSEGEELYFRRVL